LSKKEILGIWRNMPVYRIILEELIRKPQGLTEREIISILKKEHGITVSKKELYQALLKLEINGYVKVEPVGKNIVASLSPNIYKLFRSNKTYR